MRFTRIVFGSSTIFNRSKKRMQKSWASKRVDREGSGSYILRSSHFTKAIRFGKAVRFFVIKHKLFLERQFVFYKT